jgi:4-diphosphocytidyl-2-C-methyl-D-erythritol kinase
VGKRNDGYHNIETVFFPLPLYDVLELIDANETSLSLYGLPIPGNIEDNIVLKAYHLLKKDFPKISSVHFHLLKNIPIGAGLGAGSANGANALLTLNKKFELNLSTKKLVHYALQLGSDCPFFIINRPVFASGRGEKMTEISLNLSAYQLVIVNPKIHISTPWAFQQQQPQQPKNSLQHLITTPIKEWKDCIKNDFEPAVFKVYPEIENIKNKLYEQGALFASMSGSGSTVYALFEKNKKLVLNFNENYFVKILSLQENS